MKHRPIEKTEKSASICVFTALFNILIAGLFYMTRYWEIMNTPKSNMENTIIVDLSWLFFCLALICYFCVIFMDPGYVK